MNHIPASRLQEIAEEIIDLLGAGDILGFLTPEVGDAAAVEQRLQEVMQDRQRFASIELAMYLRTSSSRSDQLPSWQPLLNAAIEMARMRGEPAEDLFYGMMPSSAVPNRNTGKMQ